MRKFKDIYAIAAKRKGGVEALEAILKEQNSKRPSGPMANDRWLSCMTRCIFQAGFNWKVVENMWPGFEEVFHGFDLGYCTMLNEDDFARLVSDKRIVRYGAKIRAVQQNAVFLNAFAKDFESVDDAFRRWPAREYVNLLAVLKKQGSRLGGNTGQYFLRFMGLESFILSRDVVARLRAEGIVDKMPSSQKSMVAVQDAFNIWQQDSKRSLTDISRVLAMSVGV